MIRWRRLVSPQVTVWCLAVLGLALVDSAVVAQTEGGVDPFSKCEASWQGARNVWNGCSCFYTLAVSGEGSFEQAGDRLRGHLDADPADACLSFYLGRLLVLQGDLAGDAGAESLLLRAAEGYGQRGETKGEVYARINLSRVLHGDGRVDASARQLDSARRVAHAAADEMLLAQVDLQRAKLQLARGEGLESVERSVEALASTPLITANSTFGRDVLQTLGNVRYELGRYVDAETAFRRMAEVCRVRADLYGEATATQNLVITRLARGPSATTGTRQREELVALQRAALDAAVAAEQGYAEAAGRTLLGKLLAEAGTNEAERQLRAAVAVARELGAVDLESQALAALAAHFVDRSLDEARRLADESLELAMASPIGTATGLGWVDRMEVTWRTLPREEALAEVKQTLRWIEDVRSRQVEEGGRARLFGVWTEVHYALSGRLLEERLAGPAGTDPQTAFELMEQMRARVLLEGLGSPEETLEQETPPCFATLDDVQGALAEDEALLSFQLGSWHNVYGDPAGGAWLLAVTRGEVQVHRLPGKTELDPGLEIFSQIFERRDGSERRPARRLFDQLLAPAQAELPPGVDRLVLVPDGRLYGLPFAALLDEDERPLALRYELTEAPSATLWLRGRRAERVAPGAEIVAFADPVLTAATDVHLDPLPHARREGRSAIRRLGDGRLLLGDDASEAAVKSLAQGDVSLLHFAAHAVLDPKHPKRSAVVLAPGSGEDGLLQPHEIATLDLDGAVVVLSTCRSASGETLAGEGPLSLSRAFLQAGASTVIGSLWPLRDDETAELFDAFYRHLAAGRTVSESLAEAQRDRIEEGEPPAAWAGVVLLGKGSVAFPATERPSAWIYVLALAVGLGLAIWLGSRTITART